jgi:TonB family protein
VGSYVLKNTTTDSRIAISDVMHGTRKATGRDFDREGGHGERVWDLPGTLDELHANWKKTDAADGPDSQSIGLFYFVDGKFRLNGSFHEVRVLSTTKGGTTVPGRLINRIQPVYPKEAQILRIQGVVAVNVAVRKDGTVKVQNVGAGHPLLAPAAVEAVQQWRYEPTTINGEPVEVQTKVYVTFTLNKQ